MSHSSHTAHRCMDRQRALTLGTFQHHHEIWQSLMGITSRMFDLRPHFSLCALSVLPTSTPPHLHSRLLTFPLTPIPAHFCSACTRSPLAPPPLPGPPGPCPLTLPGLTLQHPPWPTRQPPQQPQQLQQQLLLQQGLMCTHCQLWYGCWRWPPARAGAWGTRPHMSSSTAATRRTRWQPTPCSCGWATGSTHGGAVV